MQPERRIWFQNLCIENGLVVKDHQIEQMDYYVDLLLEWNKKINLISRKDIENIWPYHILHCISPLFKINIEKESNIVDIGTGGGLPGIPIKIMRPDLSFLCIDSTQKKTKVVIKMIEDLKISNIDVIWGRVEEVGMQKKYLQKFDYAIARAVAPLSKLITWSMNFLKMKEKVYSSNDKRNEKRKIESQPALIAFKGGDLKDEIESAKQKYPKISLDIIELDFKGSEQLINKEKKLLIVNF